MNSPVTREIADKLDDLLRELAAPLPPPIRTAVTGQEFRWEHVDQTPLVLLIAKTVRMVSGIRASLMLADAGFVTESASLLRMISDFQTEVVAIATGMLSGKPTVAQHKFVEQFFALLPRTPEEMREQEKKSYVSREDLLKSHVNLANEHGQDGEGLRDATRFLNRLYDSYVHGGYQSAMELYHGDDRWFMTSGHTGGERLAVARVNVAGKLLEILTAMELIALVERNEELFMEIRGFSVRLASSGEDSRQA